MTCFDRLDTYPYFVFGRLIFWTYDSIYHACTSGLRHCNPMNHVRVGSYLGIISKLYGRSSSPTWFLAIRCGGMNQDNF